jgi:hypothetical protein
MARLGGIENDEIFRLNIDLASSGLPSADEALDEAYGMAMHAAISRQLNPPSLPSIMPPLPVNVPYIIIGHEIETGQEAWFFAEEDICCGVVIVGVPGCGKTVSLAPIIAQLPPTHFAYLPDSKREVFRLYNTLKLPFLYIRPCDLPMSLLACPTDAPEIYYTGLMEKWAPIFPLRDETWPHCAAALATASKILKKTGGITISQAAFLSAKLAESGGNREKFGTFSAQMSNLAQMLGKNANLTNGPDIIGRYRGLGVDFSGISLKSRHIIENAITQQFLQGQLSNGFAKRGKYLILIHDEGADTFSSSNQANRSRPSWQDDLLVKSRALKVGKIVILQFLSQSCDSLLSSMRVLIVMRLPDPNEARLAVRYLNLTDDYIPIIQNLPNGEAFFKTSRLPHGVHVKIPFIDLGPYPSDGDIASRMASEIKWVEDNSTYAQQPDCVGAMDAEVAKIIDRDICPPITPEPVAVIPEQVMPVQLLGDWSCFLSEIIAHPDSNSTQHGKNLKWGMYKTNRIKKEVVEAGLVAATKQKTVGRPSERLMVTRKGMASLEALKTNDKK